MKQVSQVSRICARICAILAAALVVVGITLFAIGTLIRNFAIISVIVVVGVLVSMVSRVVRRRKRGAPAQQPAVPLDSP